MLQLRLNGRDQLPTEAQHLLAVTGGPTDLPEPDDLFAVPGVVSIDRVPLPVLQVHLLHAAEHHLHTHTANKEIAPSLFERRPDRR